MSDLFTRPPFNPHHYILERNKILAELYPENEELYEEQNKRIKTGQSTFDMNRTQFDALSPADQLRVMGVKSAPKQQILTPAQAKAKRQSRFAEDNIVNAWAKWFKLQWPNIPYTIDKRAQARKTLSAAIFKAADYKRGNPDIFIQSPKAGFSGCYIEQKKSEKDLFYDGTRILKPGNDNRHIWQALYHAELREQGYWVMFSVSLEASIKIADRYMKGNPYLQQVYEYKCKPDDYRIFEGSKHFKPVAA